ncbi:interleukin-3 receptor class 2 subunit beta-like [Protopterus annectens]|uniref:interleukin-3 receptor class 2 subunit beta-like n=1 Tax=Protopterus annectens TaxID=7888 RepID=UPI001CF97F10|nr:interleukin-3 receptor class 2 subunit beta-like [Protopterus annectens]XP_043922438.1 interleukin-3 receptor class 2 subunit beta-like [Protopterus annectens]
MFYKILILLWFHPTTLAIKENTLLESLQCCNDYQTDLECTWNESRKAFSIIPMKLQHIREDDPEATDSPLECKAAENNTSFITWKCHKKVKFFVGGTEDFYFFKPTRELKLKANVTLHTSIKPRIPQNLKVTTEKNGDFTLTWETAYGNQTILHGQLQAEVSYKRDWEPWEDAQSILVADGINYLQIQKASVVPGNGYAARIRLKPHDKSNYKGRWSSWSSEVKWQTAKGDEAEPKNLRCTFDGIEKLMCTWEVRKDVSKSILYNLNYTDDAKSGESEESCQPVTIITENNETITYGCTIRITNHSTFSMYQIAIRPKETAKQINPTSNIKINPPENVTAEVLPKDSICKISWKLPFFPYNIERQYELLYKKLDESWETAQVKKLDYNTLDYIFGEKVLEPATKYAAKIRNMIKPQKTPNGYGGTWSEWSSEVQWTMPEEFELSLLAWIFVPTAAIIISLIYFYGYKQLKSAKSRWEDKIPNPKKSSLWNSVQNTPLMALSSSSLDLSPVSQLQMEQRLMKPVLIKAGSSTIIGVEEPHRQFILGKTMDVKHSGSVLALAVRQVQDFMHSSPSKIYIGKSLPKSSLDYDLNGPYLTCPRACSLPDFISDIHEAVESDDFKHNIKGYATLPQYCTESMPLLENQSPGIYLPAFDAYCSHPSHVNMSYSVSLFPNDYVRSCPPESTAVQSQSLTGGVDGKDKDYTSVGGEFTYGLSNTLSTQDESSGYAGYADWKNKSRSTPAVLQSSESDYVITPSGKSTQSLSPYTVEDQDKKENQIRSLRVMEKELSCPAAPDDLPPDSNTKNVIAPGKTGELSFAALEETTNSTEAQDLLANGQESWANVWLSESRSPDFSMTPNTDEIQRDKLSNNSVPFQLPSKEDSSDEAVVMLNPEQASPVFIHQIGDYCCICDATTLHQTSVIPLKEYFKEAGDIPTLHPNPPFKQKAEDTNLQELGHGDSLKPDAPEGPWKCKAINNHVCLPYSHNQEPRTV